MKHWFTYPLVQHPSSPEFMSGDSVIKVAKAAEAAGFDGMGFTDHPAPSHKWLNAGGHDAFDPFVALAVAGAVTTKLLLIPNIIVLPYRNPFLTAKSSASVDCMSNGRFVLSVATGYLRSEYTALGMDFEARNELFDEAIDVIKQVWAGDEVSVEGHGYKALGVTANPKPKHIPIWIGGNSPLTRRRVATVGDGWNPFPASPGLAKTARTIPLAGLDDLAPMLDHLWRHVDAAGRDKADIDVTFSPMLPGVGSADFNADATLEQLDRMAAIGVTWTSGNVSGASLAQALESIEQYGKEVIAPYAAR
ncbi:MAG: LLM class F420-dependent oxidoreductase [Acidimicrobiia bacterium]